MILDVGCGNTPRGHVNMDLFMNTTTRDLKNKGGNTLSLALLGTVADT